MNRTEDSVAQEPPDRETENLAKCELLIEAAEMHRFRDEPEACFEACTAVLQSGEMSTKQALQVSVLLAKIGQNELAADIQRRVLEHMQRAAAERPDDAEAQRQAGLTFKALRQNGKAVDYLYRALELDPTDDHLRITLSTLRLVEGDADAAMAHWTPRLDELDNPASMLLTLAQMFVKFDLPATAEELLARARPHCDEKQMLTHDITIAALRGEDFVLDQHAKAIELFDSFSERYDSVLDGLANNGPQIVARAVGELGLPADGTRQVLDAGCGTGLCAPYLRPYANQLHGADISIGMLETARDKGVYDYLTRTDLSNPATYPTGRFDLVVSNDTLVYFGALDTVIGNLFTIINPGGWFVFTVEEATRHTPTRGYAVTPSGRYMHTEAYLRGALAAAGFPAPKVLFRDVLRTEFGKPVGALAMAVERPG